MGKYDEIFDDWELKHARIYVTQYKARFKALAREDFDDLLQECLVHWFIKRDQYDEKKQAMSKTFMSRVIENKLMDILKSQSRHKRRTSYMSMPLEDFYNEGESGSDVAFAVEDKQLAQVINADIRLLIDRAVQKLSRRQKEICRLIKDDGMSLREVGRMLNMSKGAIYDETMRIREVFYEEGLKDYLGK